MSEEEYADLEKDWCRIPNLVLGPTKAGQGTKIKKGTDQEGNSFDSFWEFVWFTYQRHVGNSVQRNKTHWLHYTSPTGERRKFYPDFIMFGKFYEVKGRFTETDRAKQEQHPEVVFVFGDEIDKMKKFLNKNSPGWDRKFHES